MRKLAWGSFSFAGTVLLCHYLIPDTIRLWCFMAVVVTAVCSFFLHSKIRVRLLLVCVFSLMGILRYDVHAKESLGLEIPLQGNEYRITAYVSEYPVIYEDYSKVTVQLRSDKLPRVKTVLYDYDHNLVQLEPGNMIRTTVKFSSASVSAGKDTDTYISKGIYLRGTIKDEVKHFDTFLGKLYYSPLYLARYIQDVFDNYLTQRAAVFMKALVTGEKNSLYECPELYHILQKAGLSHVVAVSGMHISFLVGMIMMLFGNRRGWIASIVSIIVFAFMTGLSPSVLRAGLMQMLYLLAPVLRKEPDGLTSIAFALLVLLTINPFSIASVSLQLSFTAMLGIVLVTPRALEWFRKKGSDLKGIVRKVYFFIASSLSASIGASLFTIPLCALHFGSISVFAPVSNLLVLWIVPVCFALGFVLFIVSLISVDISLLIGCILSWLVEFVYYIAQQISDIPYSTVYLPMNIMLYWLICIYLIIGITYLLKGNHMYRPIIPMCSAILSMLLLVFCVTRYYEKNTTVAAIDVGQGQCIVALNGDTTILIDCGGTYDSGQRTVDWLSERGRLDVDCVIITHFDEDHTNGLIDLMTQMDVNEVIYCSLNLSDRESDILDNIQFYAEMCNTKLVTNNTTNTIKRGNVELELFVPKHPEDNNGLMVLVTVDEFDMLVTGDADIKTEKEMMQKTKNLDGECLVVGHHGSKYSTCEELISWFNPEFSFISCGYNQYGHPTKEVIDRLEKRNVVIYRTDILGSVEVKVR